MKEKRAVSGGYGNASGTRRSVLAGLSAAVGTAGLGSAACGAGGNTPNDATPKQLKSGAVVQWGIEGSPQSRLDLRTKQVQLFEAKFPGIKVDQLVRRRTAYEIKATMAAGTPYDLIRITTTQYAGFANQSALITL